LVFGEFAKRKYTRDERENRFKRKNTNRKFQVMWDVGERRNKKKVKVKNLLVF